jgi:hypothetical protein
LPDTVMPTFHKYERRAWSAIDACHRVDGQVSRVQVPRLLKGGASSAWDLGLAQAQVWGNHFQAGLSAISASVAASVIDGLQIRQTHGAHAWAE